MNKRTPLSTGATALLVASGLSATEYPVLKAGNDHASGSSEKPFLTISKVAEMAQSRDVITVQEGVYRERINPPRGGLSDELRILYRAAPDMEVGIKGSKVVTDSTLVEDDTWKLSLPKSYFSDVNPYNECLQGAWYEAKKAHHSGAMYLNGHWLKEAASKELVVISLDSGNGDSGAAELINIQSMILGVGGNHDLTDWCDGSEGAEVITDDFEPTGAGPFAGEQPKQVRMKVWPKTH